MDLTGYGIGSGYLSLIRRYINSGYGENLGLIQAILVDKDDYGTGYYALTFDDVNSGYGRGYGTFALLLDGFLIGSGASDGRALHIYTADTVPIACFVMNLDTRRTYQYSNYDFVGMGRFKSDEGLKVIGARGSKIFDLETESLTDDKSDINAYIEITTDFLTPNNKAVRALYVEDGKCFATLIAQNGSEFVVNIPANEFASLPKEAISRSWTIRVHNDSVIRRITGKISTLAMKGS